MNQNERLLFQYCKSGDVKKVRDLVEKEDVCINIRDKWDSTPLYYACLCGYSQLVEYLLSKGAKCDLKSFDGERCHYGALTNAIRELLKSYVDINQNKIGENQGSIHFHMATLLETGRYSDFKFIINNRTFLLHKCILAARSEYFREKFRSRWKTKNCVFKFNEEVIPDALQSVLQFIYTNRISMHRLEMDNVLRLAQLFKLGQLVDLIEDHLERIFFIQSKFKKHQTRNEIVLELPLTDDTLQQDLRKIAIDSIDKNLFNLKHIKRENEYLIDERNTSDLMIQVAEYNFYVHKAFFVERSEYFRVFVEDPFDEIKQLDMKIPSFCLKDIELDEFIEIVFFIYTDNFTNETLNFNTLFNIMALADVYLMTNLKRKCANLIVQYIDKDNCVELLRLAKAYQLNKLEFSCIKYIAINLPTFFNDDDFYNYIAEDAKNLKIRQETDTIEIIDEIRYAINENDNGDAQIKLYLIDSILNKLNLEG